MPPSRVRDLMSREVATLKRNDQLSLADDVMRLGRIRHLPVVDDEERVVGILSQRDLFRSALARTIGYGEHGWRKVLDMLAVKEVMTTDVFSTSPDTPLAEAARVMLERKIGALPVTGTANSSAFSRSRISSRWPHAHEARKPAADFITTQGWAGRRISPRAPLELAQLLFRATQVMPGLPDVR